MANTVWASGYEFTASGCSFLNKNVARLRFDHFKKLFGTSRIMDACIERDGADDYIDVMVGYDWDFDGFVIHPVACDLNGKAYDLTREEIEEFERKAVEATL